MSLVFRPQYTLIANGFYLRGGKITCEATLEFSSIYSSILCVVIAIFGPYVKLAYWSFSIDRITFQEPQSFLLYYTTCCRTYLRHVEKEGRSDSAHWKNDFAWDTKTVFEDIIVELHSILILYSFYTDSKFPVLNFDLEQTFMSLRELPYKVISSNIGSITLRAKEAFVRLWIYARSAWT